MFEIAEVVDVRGLLLKFEKESPEETNERKIIFDSRRQGKNCYANEVCKSFDIIHRLLKSGKSRNSIFQYLQKEGVFDDDADVSNFYKSVKREAKRRGMNIFYSTGSSTSTLPTTVSSPLSTSGMDNESSVAEGIEYLRDGKPYVMWKGEELPVPDDFYFSRGMMRPKAKNFDVDDDKTEKRYSFSDYPKHIQAAMEENLAKYPKLEAGKMNRELVAQWKKDGAKK